MNELLNQFERWCASDYASHFFACERQFLDAGLRQTVGPSVLQLGNRLDQTVVDEFDLPFLVKSADQHIAHADILLDPAFLPFEPDSFSTVVLPHVLEGHVLPHQVLREAHRVLDSEGHIVITGFNPASFMGLQRFLRPSAVCPGRYYSVSRVKDWLQLLGFEIVASSMFHYAPLSKSVRFQKTFFFLESVGDRWLPMTGGGYMISAKKREQSGTLVGRVRFNTSKQKLVTAATTKTSVNRSTITPEQK